MEEQKQDPIILPAGERRAKLMQPPHIVPLDSLEEPGAVTRANMTLRILKRAAAVHPDRVFWEFSDHDPMADGIADLWMAGIVRLIAWASEDGMSGLAVTIHQVVEATRDAQ